MVEIITSYPIVTDFGVFQKYIYDDRLTPEEEQQIQESIDEIEAGKYREIPIEDYIKELDEDSENE